MELLSENSANEVVCHVAALLYEAQGKYMEALRLVHDKNDLDW